MAGEVKVTKGPCNLACTKTMKLMTEQEVPPGVGTGSPSHVSIDGYRFVNIFVEFTQNAPEEAPVDLGVVFSLDAKGGMMARRYVNLEENLAGPQSTSFIEVSGHGSWHGSPHNVSSYVARIPVMGPFMRVFVSNRAAVARKVTVGAYLVS